MEKVCAFTATTHLELAEIGRLFGDLLADLMPHLVKGKQILFPYIRNLEAGGSRTDTCCASGQGPIGAWQEEHDQAGEILPSLKPLSSDHTQPQGACGSYRSLYMGLQTLEKDLHLHINIESHLLFLRAAALEAAVPQS